MTGRARRAILWAGTALGLGVILAMLLRYDPEAVLAPLARSDVRILALVAALLASVQVLNAVTPALLLGPSSPPLSLWRRARVFLATQPLSLVTPGRLSDFGAAVLLRRHYPPGALASAVVVDRLITLFFLLLLAPLALHFVWPARSTVRMVVALAASLATLVALPFVLLDRRVREAVNRTVLLPFPGLLRGFGDHLAFLLRDAKTRVAANFGLTALKTLLSAAIITLLARNVGLSIGIGTTLWVSVLIQLATSVPISIQGIGVAEASLVALLGLHGHPEALALSMGVMARVLFLPVFLGIYLSATVPLMSQRLEGEDA